ncbi:uncharacterized protein LY89DRAFT_788922 [Mollisia scopiformis]|uniref:Uncharacterized protein n=1 Tax=Mollisia scopiformis TaxID=149040 RepID=A0A132B824_MOLSC|nr:uncharacterized protein LY89DRAFT_788922 [Mollisia scopiformis]KUJ08560.1 hypothetical protein LY89DRAFT_788922 [Mollisia scopiformis]
MFDKIVNDRRYRQAPRKDAKSDSRTRHSFRSKHMRNDNRREEQWSSHENRALNIDVSFPDTFELRDDQAPKARAYARPDCATVSMPSIFKTGYNGSIFDRFGHRDVHAEEPPPSSKRRSFPYVRLDSSDANFFDSSSRVEDDKFHADECMYTQIGGPSTMRPRSGAFGLSGYNSCYNEPSYYDCSLIELAPDTEQAYEDHPHNSFVEDEFLKSLLPAEILSLYQQTPELPLDRHDTINASGHLLEIEAAPIIADSFSHGRALIEEAPLRLYDTFSHQVDTSEDIINEVMVVTGDIMDTMMESVLAVDVVYGNPTLEAELENSPDPPFNSSYHREPRDADISRFLQQMALHTQSAPPPPPLRPHFVDPNHIPLRNLAFEQTTKSQDDHPPSVDSKAQLDRYNKWWTDAQAKTSTTPAVLDGVLRFLPSTPPSPQSEPDWRWAAHKFFCLAFNLQPLSIPQQDTSDFLTFTAPPTQATTNLRALRAQLKLEKVRWHEDKLRSLFGDAVARDERSKSVWSAVIGLKETVERALEES